MAYRKVVLAEGQIYHVFNRGVEKRDVFMNKRDYSRFLETTAYYQLVDPLVRFSHRHRLKKLRLPQKKKLKKLVEIIAYCLMPNHFHFLLKQISRDGTSIFMSKLTNSYTRYFNIKNERVGPLFQGVFKAVRITSNEQLIHVSRYIHLNPVIDYLVKDLKGYPFSSYHEYLDQKKGISSPAEVLNQFKSAADYKQFVLDQEDYARELKGIGRLLLE